MNWTDEPATDCQIRHLQQLGCKPDHPLTKGEAAHLIRDYEEHPGRIKTARESAVAEADPHEALHLHEAVEQARVAATTGVPGPARSSQPLDQAMTRRQEFWQDTCREPPTMHHRSAQVFDLYMKHGCRFLTPTTEQAQEILDALDAAMATWDRDYPHLFYQTLEMNFPSLVARHSGI